MHFTFKRAALANVVVAAFLSLLVLVLALLVPLFIR